MKHWIKNWLTSDPSVPVTVTAMMILVVISLVYYFIIDPNSKSVGSSISFGVTTAAFFVALMIFRIQTYTPPLCSLLIAPQICDESYIIRIYLNMDNVGQSVLRTKLLHWDTSKVMKVNNNLLKVITTPENIAGVAEIPPHWFPYSIKLFTLFPCLDRQEDEDARETFRKENVFYNQSAHILVKIQSHGFIVRHIFGNRNISFSSEDVQTALDAAMETISHATPGNMQLKVERVWQSHSLGNNSVARIE
jgi:hypothetical protein